MKLILFTNDQSFERDVRAAITSINGANALNIQFVLAGVANTIPRLFEQISAYNPEVALLDARSLQGMDQRSMLGLTSKLWEQYTSAQPAMITRVLKLPSMQGSYDDLSARENNGIKVVSLAGYDQDSVARLLGMLIGEYMVAINDLRNGLITRATSYNAVNIVATGGWKRQMVAVWSIKGGVGKTFISKELAAILGIYGGRKVVALDLDTNCGGWHGQLPIEQGTTKGLAVLAHAYSMSLPMTTDDDVLEQSLRNGISQKQLEDQIIPVAFDKSSRTIDVLLGLYTGVQRGQVAFTGRVGQAFINHLLQTTWKMGYDFVICDVGQSVTEVVHMHALQKADVVFAIITPDRATVIDMISTLDHMRKFPDLFGSIDDRFQLILNKWSEESGLNREEIVRLIGLPEAACIPADRDYLITRTANFKQSFAIEHSNHPITKELISIAAKLYPPILSVQQSAQAGGTIFGRLFGRK